MAEAKNYSDSDFTADNLIFYYSVKTKYIDIGFPNLKGCVKAMSKPIYYNEKPILMKATQYTKN